jgi:hypothetical protein
MISKFLATAIVLLSAMALATVGFGQTSTVQENDNSATAKPAAEQVVANIQSAAQTLIKSFDEDQQQKLLFDFTDLKQRERWSNLPTGIFERAGLRMGDMSPTQQKAVLDLIRSTLSKQGFQQVVDNMHGEEVLARNSRPGGRTIFGEDEYYVSILGDPSDGKPWMWQFSGHHLAINATIVGKQVTIAPSLTGGQPADFEWQGKSIRQVAVEEDTAYEFVASLTAEQKKSAILGETFTNLQFGPTTKSVKTSKTGIALSSLTPAQQSTVTKLIQSRIGILNSVHAKIAMDRIIKNFDQTYFAWYGSTEPGQAATFRIQGPTIILEYAPQRMRGQGDPTSHIHAMYRDPTNEYGVKWIKEFGNSKK